MYKFMLIILSLVVILFSSSCAPYPVVAKTSGLPFGTVITLGGKKMIVVSQENEKVRLKPYKSAVVKSPVVVKTVESIPEGPKPEWESKKVVTEGVKNVQECLNPMGCPQDVKTGECLEGCSEQKVKIEMTETIIDSTNVNVISTTGPDHDLVLTTLLTLNPYHQWRGHFEQFYGKPAWICVVAHKMGTIEFKTLLTRIIYTTPNLLNTCNNKVFPSDSRQMLTPWTRPEIISSL